MDQCQTIVKHVKYNICIDVSCFIFMHLLIPLCKHKFLSEIIKFKVNNSKLERKNGCCLLFEVKVEDTGIVLCPLVLVYTQ